MIENKSPKEVFNIINNDTNKDIVILDVRTPEEYNNEGHINGAILINVQSNNFKDEVNKLDKNKKYIVYCKGGVRSLTACKIMEQLGFKNLINLEGGIINWKNSQYDVE